MASFYDTISNGTAIGTNAKNSDQVLYAVGNNGEYVLVDIINNSVIKTYTGGNHYNQYILEGNDKDTIDLFTNLNHFDDTTSSTKMIKDWYIGPAALSNLESKYQSAMDYFNMTGENMPTKTKNVHDTIYVIDGITYTYDGDNNRVTKTKVMSNIDSETNSATDSADEADAKATHIFTDEPYYQNKMTIFQKTINQIEEDLNNGRAVYTMYMKFWVGANGTGQTILVDTTSKDWLENCFIDFTHEKNGSGLANQFTLTCIFKPNDRGVRSAKEFESKLLTVSASQLMTDKSTDTKALVGCCEFQYGYDNLGILSPIYTGMFTGYDSKIENGNLKFTIKGFSNACLALERRLSTKNEYIEGCDENTPFKFLENIVDIEFEGIYKIKYCGGVQASNPHCATDDFMHFSQKTFFQIFQDTLAATLSEDDNPQRYKTEVTVETTEDTEQRIKNEATENSGNLALDNPMNKQIYTFFIDDSEDAKKDAGVSGGIIWISLMTKPNSETDATKYKSYITFNWFGYNGSGINHLVKDWNPQYDGSVLMALAYSVEREKITEYLVMDKDGNLVNTTSIGASRVGLLDQGGGEKILNIALEYDNWSRATQYPYKANMTLIGIPCEIPILGIISVQANLVYGSTTESHHSSGDYMILKIVDKMSSNGFWTSLELFKVNIPKVELSSIQDAMNESIETNVINEIEKESPNLEYNGTTYYNINGNYYAISGDKDGSKNLYQITKQDFNYQSNQKDLETGDVFEGTTPNILYPLSDNQREKAKNNSKLKNMDVNNLLQDGYGNIWLNENGKNRKLDVKVSDIK